MRWVHSTELADPTPWLKGGELLLTTGMQLTAPKVQRELIERLVDHDIAGLGFGTGFAHKRLPAALVTAARAREFPLFEVPYELPFIAVTERAFTRLLDERYELLQRALAGDVLSELLNGHLYPEDLQARLRPFGIGEQVAVLAFRWTNRVRRQRSWRGCSRASTCPAWSRSGRGCCARWSTRAGPAEGSRRRRSRSRASCGPSSPPTSATCARPRSRATATHSLRMAFHEARCALEAVRLRNGNAPEVASYEDLGAFQLLLSLQDDDALNSYCRSVLGPIEQGEGDYGEELVRSLDVFIEHNGHWEKAANALYCHRHTLRYRIRRIEQLTGRDFSNARDRIEFWLALRGRELAR